MFRYLPPKSSVWGHSLGRRKVSVIAESINAFMTDVVEEPLCRGGHLSVSSGFGLPQPQNVIEQFENSIGIKLARGYAKLDESQCHVAIEQALSLLPTLDQKLHIDISRTIEFDKWRLNDELVNAPDTCRLTWRLGTNCSVSTELYFNSEAEFTGLSELFTKYSLGKLKPNHLKECKK
ncbi:hypothetical protein [Alteromonas lipolytica]|uniref:Uncharacterized protein n=1 Tax=Alteromonas lipolytica TaxID=1856405 RepID=A0A1E8FFS9_9ALTE|nr:hypothetical protein [Alteromonas lipolytica]OFI34759.1 hypothetical protein BFC17_14360 [Alteromonas lipolytica]